MGFETDAIFGGGSRNDSSLPDSRFTATGGGIDYGAVLADGIFGRINQEIQSRIGGAVDRGQLVPSTNSPAYRGNVGQNQMLMYLVVGGLVYLVAKA